MIGFWEREQRRKEIETKKERKKERKKTNKHCVFQWRVKGSIKIV
jgi:hypothetical protein